MTNPFRPIAISLIPNFQLSEVLLAGKLLLSPGRYMDRRAEKLLTDQLAQHLGRKYVVLFESGRAAEYFLLQALGVSPGEEVIIQAFTCVAVPNSVIWTGAKPVYVDIDETYNLNVAKLEKAITPKTKAVIVQHTFGKPADIEKIQEMCKKHNLVLVEDCAHGLGNSYRGKKLGSFGHAAFLSFGRDKVISGVWGGAVVTDDEDLSQRIHKLVDNLPRRSSGWLIQQLTYPLWIYIVLNIYYFFSFGKAMHFWLRRCKLLPDVLTGAEKEAKKPNCFCQLPGLLASLVLNQLNNLDRFVEHRRKLAKFYAEQLGESFEAGASYLRYSIEVNDPVGLRQFAAKRGIFLGDWYDHVVAPKGVDLEKVGYRTGSCPQAEKLCKRIVNLPTNPNMGMEEARKVVEVVQKWLKSNNQASDS